MPRRRNSARADDASTTSVTIFFNAHVFQNYALTISSGTDSPPHCPLHSRLLDTSSHRQHASQNPPCTYAQTQAHAHSTFPSTRTPHSLTPSAKAAPTRPSVPTSRSRHTRCRPRYPSVPQMSSNNSRPTPIHIYSLRRNENSGASRNATQQRAHRSPATT